MTLETPLTPNPLRDNVATDEVSPGATIPNKVQADASPVASKEGHGKYVQEKVMLGLTLVFILGVLAFTYIPAPFNGAAMGLITFLTIFAMFHFG